MYNTFLSFKNDLHTAANRNDTLPRSNNHQPKNKNIYFFKIIIKKQAPLNSVTYVRCNAHQRISMSVKFLLQRDDNRLQILRLFANVPSDLANVRIVEGRIDFVQHKERCRLIAVYGKQQRQRCDRLFATAQIAHGLKPFAGRNTIVIDALQVRFFGIVGRQICLGRFVACQRLVNAIDRFRNVVATLLKLVVSGVLNLFKGGLCFFALFSCRLELFVGGRNLLRNTFEHLHRFHVGRLDAFQCVPFAVQLFVQGVVHFLDGIGR